MYLSLFLLLVLICYGVSGIGLSIYRLVPAFGSWYSMELSDYEKRIELRRFFTISILLVFKISFINELSRNFNWVLFTLVCIISTLVLFLIYILDSKSFQIGFKTGVYPKRNGTISRVLKYFAVFKFRDKITKKDSSTHLVVKCIDAEIKYINKGYKNSEVLSGSVITTKNLSDKESIYLPENFSDVTFEKLKKFKYLIFPNETKEEFVYKLNNSEKQLFKFRNKDEAKYFYMDVIIMNKIEQSRFAKLCNLSVDYFKKGIKEDNLSAKFKKFIDYPS